MTATLHRIGAGDGYRYYTAMVASADEQRELGEKLGDYYARSGNPAGVWMGAGLTALGVDGEVKESQLANLLGLGLHPDTGAQLGSRYRIYATVNERVAARTARLDNPSPADIAAIQAEEERRGERQAVAGFDSTFSPVKSVSVAWALAGPEVAAEIEAAHAAAVATTLEWIEREVATARTGTDGIGHVDVQGVVAAAFTHRTSRAGDPDLHTHVVMSNKVLATLPNGTQRWLTLDSRGLYKANVAFSERYNRVLEDELHNRLGWTFQVRSDQPEDALAPIRELAQIPEPLIVAFSQRRQQIEADYAQRVREYRKKHGHEPPKTVQYQLAQDACLAQRPAKEKGSTEAGERAEWEAVARSILSPDERAQLATDLVPATGQPTLEDLPADQVAEIAREVVEDLQERRSDWTDRHVAASAHRHTASLRFASPLARDRAIAAITAAARDLDDVVAVSAPERVSTPNELRRENGEPIWQAPASLRSSTRTLLAAEARLLDAARQEVPAEVQPHSAELVLGDHDLAADQLAVVRQLTEGQRRVQLLVGPAGTGKTTTMRALVDLWQRAGGRPVRGLAPTAAAASVLRTETGMDQAATIDYWATLRRNGHHSATFQRGELVIVDEAGMAGTLNLDRVVRAATEDGAQVVLVGDPHQLAAIASGGGLRLIQNEIGAAQLSTVWRFSDVDPATGERVLRTWEAEASLGLRLGEAEAIEPYFEHGRIHSGSRDAMVEDIYTAWLRDQNNDVESVMIATDNATVQALSDRARADRIAAGQVTGRGVELRNGSQASVGDIIVTRRNDRTLRVGGDFVKNGDLWTVTAISPDGEVAVTGKHGACVLPAEYVQRRVELGYAMTAHRAQGLTVDNVHALVDDSLSREVLYVAATRGRRSNELYAVTEQLLDAEAERPADPNQPARAVLRSVLERSDAAVSATESIRAEDEHAASTATQLERWRYVQEHNDPTLSVLDDVLPAPAAAHVRSDEAWPYLREILYWRGTAAGDDLRAAYEERSMAGAESFARVLARRLEAQDRPTTTPGDWLPATGRDPYSDALIAAARERATELGVRAVAAPPSWTEQLGPVPEDEEARAAWQQRVGLIAAYREAHGITSREPLGPLPHDPLARERWKRARAAIPAAEATDAPPPNPYAGLDVEELRTRLVDAQRLADRAARRLEAARTAQEADVRPHTDQVGQDVASWSSTIARLDQAESAAATAHADAATAAARRTELAQTEAHTPSRRERAAWRSTVDLLRQQHADAEERARASAAASAEAARGLPEPQHWPQLRAHAQAGLDAAAARREAAIVEDVAARGRAAEQATELANRLTQMQERRSALQAELDRRLLEPREPETGGPATWEVEEPLPPHQPEREHER